MKKILAVLILTFFLSAQTSQAFAPVAIPVWYYGAGALALGGGGVYVAMKSGVAPVVDTLGGLRRNVGIAYISMQSGMPTLTNRNGIATLAFAKLQSIIDAAPSVYANLKAALTYKGYMTGSEALAATGLSVGDVVFNSANNKYYRIGSYMGSETAISGECIGVTTPNPYFNTGQMKVTVSKHIEPTATGTCTNGAPSYVANRYHYSIVLVLTPTATAATPQQFSKTLTGSTSGGDALPLYHDEMDQAMKAAGSDASVIDDASGQPFTAPPGVMTPAQVKAANAAGEAADAREQAITAAQQAAASAAAARDAAVTASNADPTNQALAQKAADATAVADRAAAAAQQSVAEKEAAEAAEAAKDAEKEESENFGAVTVPSLKSFSWARFADLRGVLATTFPFNLLDRFAVILGAFVRDPVAPSFSLPMYGGNQLSFSLAMFDGIATFFRWAFASIMTIGIVHRIIVFYRGA